MRFWHRFNKRSQHDAGQPSELDACLNLLSSAPAGRGAGRDLTNAILAKAGANMPLVSGRSLRLLSAGRVAIGLGLAASVAVTALTVHAWRDEASMRGYLGQSAPASRAMASAVDGVNDALRSVTIAGQSVRQLSPASLLATTIELQPARDPKPASRLAAPARPQAVQVAALAMLRGPTGTTMLGAPVSPGPVSLGVIDRVLPARAPRDLAESVARQLNGPASEGANAADLLVPR